jgi:mono/diheme cytochrome c family protein
MKWKHKRTGRAVKLFKMFKSFKQLITRFARSRVFFERFEQLEPKRPLETRTFKTSLTVPILLFVASSIGGCRQQMADQPYARPLQPHNFFEDGMASRPLEPGTVARDSMAADDVVSTGKVEGKPADALPIPVTRGLLQRGQERYNIYCSPCHDRVGSGQGMIVQRGFRRAQSFHQQRLREAPPGYYFEVISRGFGPMPSYAAQIKPSDRWAIIAYIRALQLSRHASLAELPAADREKLKAIK